MPNFNRQAFFQVTGKTIESFQVEPGKVKWHGSVDEAVKASRQSGKPVLLFHLMGRLDRQFC